MDKAEIETRVRRSWLSSSRWTRRRSPRRPVRRGPERGLARPRGGRARPRGGVEHRDPRGGDGGREDRRAGRRARGVEARDVLGRPMNATRVVITGIGPVTPIGIGVEDFWAGLSHGPQRDRRITRFDTVRSARASSPARSTTSPSPSGWTRRRPGAPTGSSTSRSPRPSWRGRTPGSRRSNSDRGGVVVRDRDRRDRDGC